MHAQYAKSTKCAIQADTRDNKHTFSFSQKPNYQSKFLFSPNKTNFKVLTFWAKISCSRSYGFSHSGRKVENVFLLNARLFIPLTH